MVLSKKASVNDLVAEMEAALQDKTLTSIFERPVIKTASAQNVLESTLQELMDVSAKLDDLGLSKTAEKTLIAAQMLIVEAKTKCECGGEGCEKCEDENEDDDDIDIEGLPPSNRQVVMPGDVEPAPPIMPGEQPVQPLTSSSAAEALQRWAKKKSKKQKWIPDDLKEGRFKGWSLSRMKKRYDSLKSKEDKTKSEISEMRALALGIRFKGGDVPGGKKHKGL